MSNKILLGDDFWNAYNGLMDSKTSGALWDDVFSALVTSSNIKFGNMLKNNGIKLDEDELDESVSSFKPFILGGDYDLDNPNIYFSSKNNGLKESAKEAKEGLMASLYEIESRKPSFGKSLR